MRLSMQRGLSVASVLISFVVVLTVSGPKAVADNDKIPMTSAAGIFFAEIFGQLPSAPFEVPEEMWTTDGIIALNSGGQSKLAINDITHVFAVASGVLINDTGETRAVRADVGVGVGIDDRDLFSVVSAPPLSEYGRGTGGAINIIPRVVSIGSDLFGPEVNRDFRPVYSSLGKNAVWGLNPGFGSPSRIGYVTENF
ncbi:MAG: hypothetical protein ABI540_02905, partial [Spartobacteria bacterium]